MSIIDRFFPAKAQKNGFNEIEVEFYKRANAHIPHGQLIVSHKGYGLTQVPVNFVFPGLTEAPPLTKRLVNDLWSAAESQGYFPHAIASYGTTVLPQADDFEGDTLNDLRGVDLGRTPELQRHLSSKHLEAADVQPAGELDRRTHRGAYDRTVFRRQEDAMRSLATGEPIGEEAIPTFLRKPTVNPGTSAPNDNLVHNGQIRFPDAPVTDANLPQAPQSVEDLVGFMIDQLMAGGNPEFAGLRDTFMSMPDDVQELVAIRAAQKWNNVWQTQKDWQAGQAAAMSSIHYTLGDWRAAGEAMTTYVKDKYPNAADVMGKEENNDKVKEMIRIFFRAPKDEGINSVDEMLLGTLYRMAEEGKPFPPVNEPAVKVDLSPRPSHGE